MSYIDKENEYGAALLGLFILFALLCVSAIGIAVVIAAWKWAIRL